MTRWHSPAAKRAPWAQISSLVLELLVREALAGGAGDRLSQVKHMSDITEGV